MSSVTTVGRGKSLAVWSLLAVLALGAGGCDKPESPPETPASAPAGGAQTRPVGAGPANGPAKSDGLVELDVPEPPPAVEIDTPKNIVVPNLELADAKPLVIMVPPGTENVALGRPVTSDEVDPYPGELEYVTDGKKSGPDGQIDGYIVELGIGSQYVQVDLGAVHKIHAVVTWRKHQAPRAYHDVVIQVAADADFVTGVQTLFNNDHDNSSGLGAGTDKAYIESYKGKIVDAKGVKSQYVRVYSRGSTYSEPNEYIEIEVYGSPVK